MPMSRRIAATAGPSSRGFAVGFGDGECPAARMRIAHPIAAHDSGVSHLQSAWLMVHPYFPSILCYEVQRRRAPAIRALDVLSANRLNIPNNASQLMLVLLAEWLIVESPVVAVDDEAEEPICGRLLSIHIVLCIRRHEARSQEAMGASSSTARTPALA